MAVVAAFIALWANVRDHVDRFGPMVADAMLGLVMGAGAALAMAMAVAVAPGAIFDLRIAPLAVAALFGGPVAAVPALLFRRLAGREWGLGGLLGHRRRFHVNGAGLAPHWPGGRPGLGDLAVAVLASTVDVASMILIFLATMPSPRSDPSDRAMTASTAAHGALTGHPPCAALAGSEV